MGVAMGVANVVVSTQHCIGSRSGVGIDVVVSAAVRVGISSGQWRYSWLAMHFMIITMSRKRLKTHIMMYILNKVILEQKMYTVEVLNVDFLI